MKTPISLPPFRKPFEALWQDWSVEHFGQLRDDENWRKQVRIRRDRIKKITDQIQAYYKQFGGE